MKHVCEPSLNNQHNNLASKELREKSVFMLPHTNIYIFPLALFFFHSYFQMKWNDLLLFFLKNTEKILLMFPFTFGFSLTNRRTVQAINYLVCVTFIQSITVTRTIQVQYKLSQGYPKPNCKQTAINCD